MPVAPRRRDGNPEDHQVQPEQPRLLPSGDFRLQKRQEQPYRENSRNGKAISGAHRSN